VPDDRGVSGAESTTGDASESALYIYPFSGIARTDPERIRVELLQLTEGLLIGAAINSW
jgi:hypothetical protein